MAKSYPVQGAGLGLRRSLLEPLRKHAAPGVSFLEVAPENWIRVGGALGRKFRHYTERYPFVSHGLSLSLGSPAPLDEQHVLDIKAFLDQHGIRFYTEHLSYCSDDGHLYDLMPIPFTEDAVHYTASRIRRTQELLDRRIGIENVSYYAAPYQAMPEIEFINAVLEEADCDLLLDVNNIYVNSINHRYDALEFLTALPAERVVYFHVAGHYVEAEDLRIDTHGADVCDPVWELLGKAYEHFGAVPTVLERDFNIPALPVLLEEIDQIVELQGKHGSAEPQATATTHG